ncbi:MAG: GspE/PulE family protein [Pseudomonadota bacterium]
MNVNSADTDRPRLSSGGPISLDAVIDALISDGLVPRDHVGRVRSLRESGVDRQLHPLIQVAKLKLPHPTLNGRLLDIHVLTEWLAAECGLPHYRIDPMEVEVEAVTGIISQAYARRYGILPVEIQPNTLIVATSEPFDLRWMNDLSQIVRRQIKVVVASPLDIDRFIEEFYGVSRSVRRATDLRIGTGGIAGIPNFEQLLELGRSGNLNADDQHVVFIVDWLLQYAFDQRASDIHLEPRRELSNVRFRIDGRLHTVYQMPTPVMGAVNARIKVLGRMDVAEKRRPQDGRIKTRAPDGQEIELRISIMPTAFGEKCVMRIFDPVVTQLGFEELGFSSSELGIWRQMVERPHGIVLVTGPTGSGKTTTLYATLRHLASPDINVCTVEDPIEMVSPEFNQMQVVSGIGVTFASGVRTLLRQDPDVIMVGEIRDLETAQMAIQAALTGHLVLSTLHTNDAPSAITRLLDLGAPHYMLRGTVCGIVAQRLVRTLCPECKAPADLDPAHWQSLIGRWKIPEPKQFYGPVGCESCRNTGYRGRTAIYEMMAVDSRIDDLILKDTDLSALTRRAIKMGMRPLRVSAARKVIAGLTTPEEAGRVIPPDAIDPDRHA